MQIIARTAQLLASLDNIRVVEIESQIIEDLVRGEVIQLGTSADHAERLQQYKHKTFLKTASLLARSCQSVRSPRCHLLGLSSRWEHGLILQPEVPAQAELALVKRCHSVVAGHCSWAPSSRLTPRVRADAGCSAGRVPC